jgi:hypothetical protein
MSLLSAYQDLITSEHKGKPKYMATVTALLQPSNDIFELGVYMDDFFDLDEATGVQENVLGEIVGQSRQMPFELIATGTNMLDNEDYRTLLKAKIAKNLWKGGIADLEDTWQNLFRQRIKIKDNQDMTIEVQLTDVPTQAVQELILRGQVVPKPQSVGINYNVIRDLDGTIYMGGALSQHKRFTVNPAFPSDQDATTQLYVGGALSTHHRYDVQQQPPTNQEATTTAYFGGVGARYKKFTVIQQEEE